MEYPGYTEQLYYDKAGNRSRRIAGGEEEEYRYDPANHLTEYTKGGTTTTFTYDNAGNLTADNKARYTYDLLNRTERVETFDGHVQINHYDAEGLRSGIEEDGRLVQFIFRGQEVVTELETEKGMTRFIRGYELIASDADSARTYYHYASDEMGSITHVAAGEDILNRYEYDAWGNLTLCEEKVENRFKFNGQQYDPVSQQYYLRARYYNPVIGRFTQEDTYRGDGLNLYAYCWNNPVYYVDPSGHYRNCVKDAYDRIRKENPGMSAQDAYNLALKETGKDRIPNDAAQNTEQNRRRNPETERPDNKRQGNDESTQPYIPRPGDADFIGPIPSGSWRLVPNGEGAHLVERSNVRGRSDLSMYDTPDTPRYYPAGTPESAGQAHLRLHEATRGEGIKLSGGNAGMTDQQLLDHYASAYNNPSLSHITGDLRTPDGSTVIATNVTPSEAYTALIEWGSQQSTKK